MHRGQSAGQRPGALQHERGVHRVGPRRPQRVDTVREGVQPARHGESHGQVEGQLRVVDDGARQDAYVDAGRLAPVVGQAPDRGRLAPGVGGRHREDGHAGRERDRLRGAGGRTAADAQQQVRAGLGGPPAGRLGDPQRHVHPHVVDDAGGRQPLGEPVRQRAGGAGGHQQHPLGAEELHLGDEAFPRGAGAENHPLAVTLVVERQGRAHGLSSDRCHAGTDVPTVADHCDTNNMYRARLRYVSEMDVRQLRYFLAVVHERSFSRAAERLGMTQPPLSTAIAQLERELGVPLLERHPRGVEPTEAGRDLAERAALILQTLETATTAVAARRPLAGAGAVPARGPLDPRARPARTGTRPLRRPPPGAGRRGVGRPPVSPGRARPARVAPRARSIRASNNVTSVKTGGPGSAEDPRISTLTRCPRSRRTVRACAP